VRWDANFDEPRVGAPETIALLRTPGRLADGTPHEYAFGREVATYRGLRVEGSSGSGLGFRSELYRLPDQHFSVIVLANLSDLSPTALARQVTDLYLEPELERVASGEDALGDQDEPVVEADELASYAGLYWSDVIEGSHELAVKGGELQLVTSEGSYPLTPLGEGSFELRAAPRRFTFTFLAPETAGGAERLRVEVGGRRPVDYVRVEAWKPSVDQLPAFTGEFASDEGLATLNVVADGARLRIMRHRFEPDELRPIVRDVFAAVYGMFRFVRGPDGLVTAVELTTERSRHIRFNRPK
jgi:hypothetical protein